MRLIPGKTKVKIEIFKGITLVDMIVGFVGMVLVTICAISSLPARWAIAAVVALIFAALLVRLDSDPLYIFLWNMMRYKAYPHRFQRVYSDEALVLNNTGTRQETIDAFFEEDGADEGKQEEHRLEDQEKKKALKLLIKEEDKILKSKTATEEEKNAVWQARAERSAQRKKEKEMNKDADAHFEEVSDFMPFTGINGGFIEYNGEYYGAAIEIDPIEFRFFSEYRRNNSIENCVGKILRGLSGDYGANIVKLERPVIYDAYLDAEYDKLDALRKSYESGLLSEDELQARAEIQYDRINDVLSLCNEDKVIEPFYYLVLFEKDRGRLDILIRQALTDLESAELTARRLDDRGLALFLKYNNDIDFDEKEIDKIDREKWAEWAMPESLKFSMRRVEINKMITHTLRVVDYPSTVGDSWLAGVMSFPGTKVTVKMTPMDREKSIRAIDRSLSELRGQYMATSIDSKLLELQEHIETLSALLVTLQRDNEALMSVSIYITAFDALATIKDPILKEGFNTLRPAVSDIKKTLRRSWGEAGMTLSGMDFLQLQGFIGSQVSAYDPMIKESRGIPTNTIAAMFPWVFAHMSDEGGIKLGSADGVPVFIDFFKRNEERVNSNMVIIGKSGSGKSFATKSLLTNLASEDAKIFILDPENEYTQLAHTLHGKVINVGNAVYGRLNPFHIITALDDDEAGEEGGGPGGSFATHLQFLEEFFKQILPDIDRDALEYLNSLVERLYLNFGITAETDLSDFKAQDYPIFDDLYDIVLAEFERTNNEYLRQLLRSLVNYIAKFSTGGRNANIWNGPSTITTDENFSVFNFQSMLANRNTTIANAQMLLVLKYIDNEIIKNRDYNLKYGLNRKIVVVIDEAHVFIDTKFPVALDFMFQLAKRIRKYNGMQIVITQNIKDFVGSEEIARKSTAIINACQYSFVFGLAPNDMSDLCKLYEKAGGINEREQEDILGAKRGEAFTIMSPTSRSSFAIEVPDSFVDMFEQSDFQSNYFSGYEGMGVWEDFVASSRDEHDKNFAARKKDEEQASVREEKKSTFTFTEITEDEADKLTSGYSDDEMEELIRSRASEEKTNKYEEYGDALLDDTPEEEPATMTFGGITLSEITEDDTAYDEYNDIDEADDTAPAEDEIKPAEPVHRQSAVDKLIAAEEVVNRKEYDMAFGRESVAPPDAAYNNYNTYNTGGKVFSQEELDEKLEQFKASMREEMEKEIIDKLKWISIGAGLRTTEETLRAATTEEPLVTRIFDNREEEKQEEESFDFGDTSSDLEDDLLFGDEDEKEESFDFGDTSSDLEDDLSFSDDEDEEEEASGLGSIRLDDFDEDDDYEDDDMDFSFDDDDDLFGEEEGEEYEPAPFLFAELLAEAADEYAAMDLDEKMNEMGSDVIEVTLEELAEYIKEQRKKR